MENKKENISKMQIMKDCVFYQKSKCYALTEFVCENKKCTFYRKNKKITM